jgi:hypothetical protein
LPRSLWLPPLLSDPETSSSISTEEALQDFWPLVLLQGPLTGMTLVRLPACRQVISSSLGGQHGTRPFIGVSFTRHCRNCRVQTMLLDVNHRKDDGRSKVRYAGIAVMNPMYESSRLRKRRHQAPPMPALRVAGRTSSISGAEISTLAQTVACSPGSISQSGSAGVRYRPFRDWRCHLSITCAEPRNHLADVPLLTRPQPEPRPEGRVPLTSATVSVPSPCARTA